MMVMPRKKRRVITFLIILSIIIILSVIGYTLYVSTDMFKSNDVLFSKYANQLIENIKPILNEENMTKVKEILDNHKLSLDTNINVTYSNDGNTDSGINHLRMNINGNAEKSTGYNYQNVKIMKDEEMLAGVEYIEQENVSGIRLNGIKQFLSTNIQEENDNAIQKIYDLVNTDYKEIIRMTPEELQTLKDKYIQIIMSNMTNVKYSKQKDIVLKIRGERYNTNAYSVTLTKEQFNNIYIKILEEIKQEEILLSKLRKIDNAIDQYYKIVQNTNVSNIERTFIDNIEEKIKEIQNSNIGNEERIITIYECDGKAISLAIETEEYFMGLDIINTDNNNFINLLGNKKIEEGEKENSFDLKIEKTFEESSEQIEIAYNIVEEGEKIANEITTNQKMENSTTINNAYTIRRSVGTNDLKLSIENTVDVIKDFEEKEELIENENNIMIEKLNEEQVENVRNNIQNNITEQLNKIQQGVSLQDIKNILIQVKMIEEELEEISDEGVTETEKIRFNSDFQLFEGNNLSKERIIELLNLKKNNIQNITVSQYQEQTTNQRIPLEYQLEIHKEEGNTQKVENFINILKQSQYNLFSVRLEYDEETGFINNVYITIQE